MSTSVSWFFFFVDAANYALCLSLSAAYWQIITAELPGEENKVEEEEGDDENESEDEEGEEEDEESESDEEGGEEELNTDDPAYLVTWAFQLFCFSPCFFYVLTTLVGCVLLCVLSPLPVWCLFISSAYLTLFLFLFVKYMRASRVERMLIFRCSRILVSLRAL